MVRLKVKKLTHYRHSALFQFQNGAIKSGIVAIVVPLPATELPDVKTIKSGIVAIVAPSIEEFQFQNGAIKSSITTETKCVYIISIPKWCD